MNSGLAPHDGSRQFRDLLVGTYGIELSRQQSLDRPERFGSRLDLFFQGRDKEARVFKHAKEARA